MVALPFLALKHFEFLVQSCIYTCNGDAVGLDYLHLRDFQIPERSEPGSPT